MGLSWEGSLYDGVENWFRDLYIASFDFSSGKLLKASVTVSQQFTGRNMADAWSPDGKLLTYPSSRQRSNGVAPWNPDTIVIRSLETGRERVVTPNLRGMAWAPGISWSADGRSIYVTREGKDKDPGIFKVDSQTGNASILFETTPRLSISRAVELPEANAFVLSRFRVAKKTDELVVENLQSDQVRGLFHLAAPAVISGFAVSPRGHQVAFTTQSEPGGISTLRVVPVTGGNARVLFQLKAPDDLMYNSALAWTPDGKFIVFGKGSTLWSNRKVEFYKISAQGGRPRDLGLSMPTVRHFDIHPDGHRMVFESDNHSAEVWVIRNLSPASKASR